MKSLEAAVELANKALSLDDSLADAYDLLGSALVWQKKYEEGIVQLEQALELEPNSADINAHMGLALWHIDRSEEAIQSLKKAIKLNPNPPGWYPCHECLFPLYRRLSPPSHPTATTAVIEILESTK